MNRKHKHYNSKTGLQCHVGMVDRPEFENIHYRPEFENIHYRPAELCGAR